jgi:predicted nucleic acid-binding protein
MTAVLLDTDILIDHLRGHRRLDLIDNAWRISVVTRCELFAGRNTDEARLRQVLKRMVELPVEKHVAESAGRIRRTTQLTVPDALIAATALEHQLPLMTRNLRHFERVVGLTIHDLPDQPKPDATGSPHAAGGAESAPQD